MDEFFVRTKDEAGFTKGPWIIEAHGPAWALYSREDENQHGLNLMYIADPDWNFEANKKLIEAAPDLYRELEIMVRALDTLGATNLLTEKAKKILEKVRS